MPIAGEREVPNLQQSMTLHSKSIANKILQPPLTIYYRIFYPNTSIWLLQHGEYLRIITELSKNRAADVCFYLGVLFVTEHKH